MLLKKLYDMTDPKRPVVTGVQILRAGARQKFSADLVAVGEAQGWLIRTAQHIVIKSGKGDVRYRITARPGRQCCHCGVELFSAAEARAHVERGHKDKNSPDTNNPSGYRRIAHYECEREG